MTERTTFSYSLDVGSGRRLITELMDSSCAAANPSNTSVSARRVTTIGDAAAGRGRAAPASTTAANSAAGSGASTSRA
jgi:hypothetical protein